MSVFWPATPLIGLYLVSVTGWSIWYGTVLILWYLAVPMLDAMFGEDFSNPPESAVPDLERDRYYRVLTYLTVPMHYAALIGSCWWVATHSLNALEFVALALSLSGAAVQCSVRPALGSQITLGAMPGRVVRNLEDGFALEFSNILAEDSMRRLFR